VKPSLAAAGKTSLFSTLRHMTWESVLSTGDDACDEPRISRPGEQVSDPLVARATISNARDRVLVGKAKSRGPKAAPKNLALRLFSVAAVAIVGIGW
jgi:hypothetical protein